MMTRAAASSQPNPRTVLSPGLCGASSCHTTRRGRSIHSSRARRNSSKQRRGAGQPRGRACATRFTRMASPATAQVENGRSMTNEVWHVRHGQRCDEVRGEERKAWMRSPRHMKGGWFDPFLTCHGHAQASQAGLFLKSLPFNQQPGKSFDIVYTSPLIRAVQTAVCISQGLGNLPLQVVPGLASCTAALCRIGYENAEASLMTDAEIGVTFPGVTVVPRDPLAPTSFSGAVEWLAAKASETKETGGDDDDDGCSRVLAVGHREGTKAMAGRIVPTPHCCIGIFRAEASEKSSTFELHDLLSRTGKSLESNGAPSAYAIPPMITTGDENGAWNERQGSTDIDAAVEALAARVIALTLSTESSKPNAKGRGVADLVRRRASTGESASSARSTTTLSRTSSSSGATRDGHNKSSSSWKAAGLVQRVRGASSLLQSTVGKGKAPAAASSRASGAQAGRDAKGPGRATREPPRRTSSGEKEKTCESDIGGATSGGGDLRTGPPPRGKKVGSRQPATTAVATRRSGHDVSGPVSVGGVENPGLAVAPQGGACAGRGFRVVRYSSRRGSVGGGSFAGFLGMPVDMLCGESGVLSFLSPTDLCKAKATCKPVATAAESEYLWSALYLRLPKGLRDRSERGLPPIGRTQATPSIRTLSKETSPKETPSKETTHLHPKVLFARAVSTNSSSHAAKIARKVERVRRRSTLIRDLRGSVVAVNADVKVRVNGDPVSVVQTTGTRAEAWVSRSSLLGEPSVNRNDGVRTFTLSSSAKVGVPASVESVELLRSICVALYWLEEDNTALLPRISVPVVRIDDLPLPSKGRLLGMSADSAVALYDVAGSSYSSNGGRVNQVCTRNGGHGDGIILPLFRGCALLGVLPSRRHDGRQDSDSDAGGIAFLTVHFPHALLLDVATHRRNDRSNNGRSVSRRSRSYGDDSAGPRHGLDNFAVALGLRTVGVPLWESSSKGIGGVIRTAGRYEVSRRAQPPQDGQTGAAVVRLEIMRPALFEPSCFDGLVRVLRAGLGLPYSTAGSLSGLVADVLLADFTLCDLDGISVWAFTSPIVFEHCCLTANGTPGGGEENGGYGEDDGCTIGIAYKEVREERRRGVVAEPGVGKVVIEVALVESPAEGDEDEDEEGERVHSTAAQRRCPAGHAWMVRSAWVELELGFVNKWFGTKHGGN